MGFIKQGVKTEQKPNQQQFSTGGSAFGTVSSINANSNTEGTVVVKNVPIEFVQKLGIGNTIELRK